MIIINILMCIIILIIIPACIGLLVTAPLKTQERSLGLIMPAGYVCMLLSFELITLPILLTTEYQNFNYVLWIYTPVMLILAGCGVWVTIRRAGSVSNLHWELDDMLRMYRYKGKDKVKGLDAAGNSRIDKYAVWILAGAVLVFILVMAETHVIFDGDDAYYVVQSLITQNEHSMYVTQPYTGGAASLDIRHAMAVFTMWISYVGTVTGLHTTILCHTVLPLVLIPLTVITYAEVGIRLLRKHEDMLPYFVLVTELLILFGRVSQYTSETFLIARTWQGKSMVGGLLIPMLILSLYILFRDKSYGGYLLVLLSGAVAGIFSSLAVMLSCIFIVIGGIWYAVYTRRVINLICVWLCCAPGVIYMALYLYFTYVAWTP